MMNEYNQYQVYNNNDDDRGDDQSEQISQHRYNGDRSMRAKQSLVDGTKIEDSFFSGEDSNSDHGQDILVKQDLDETNDLFINRKLMQGHDAK